MSIELFLYLADVLPNIGNLATVVAVFGFVGSATALFGGVVETEPAAVKWGSVGLALSLSVAVFAALVPSKQTIYMMAGATVAKQALNSSVGQKVQQAIEEQLDEFLKKTEKKK